MADLETGEHDYQRDPAYPDDPYAYQGDYEEEPAPKKRSSGLMTVAAVLALAVVGTGAAFAYRTFVGSPRSGEPPIIRADNSPTKVVPAPVRCVAPPRPRPHAVGRWRRKLVSREETPVDVNSRSGGPRVVFPPLNQNANPPPASSVSPSAPMATAANGTMPNNEPRRIRTLAVKGDPADNGGIPAGATAPPPTGRREASPPRLWLLVLVPRHPGAQPGLGQCQRHIADVAQPSQTAPPPTRRRRLRSQTSSSPASGGYLVQVSSQKNEAEAQAVLSQSAGQVPEPTQRARTVDQAVDLGEKGRLLSRHDRPFGRVRRGGEGLQEPEIGRRPVLGPRN